MRLVVLCERSGIVRDAFRARGVDAWSCDLEACEGNPTWHLQADALAVAYGGQFDAFIAHPECRYLSASGLHWNRRRPDRGALAELAVSFALAIWDCPMPRGVIENPVGLLSTRIRPADQIVQPYDFGEDASKRTALWLRGGFPPLKPTQRVAGRLVHCGGKTVERWANQTDSGQNRLPPSPTRAIDRARTYPGVARAMAAQWAPYLHALKAAA